MSRALTFLNAAGVFALGLLCVVQWQRDRRLNIDVAALQRTNQLHSAALLEQSNMLRGANVDLVQFKERFTQAHSELTDARTTGRKLERDNDQLQSERDQLKASVTNWVNAVHERDERLKETSARAQELAKKLNDSIARFNDLATNYNESVRRFGQLATNYNNVVDDLNKLRSNATSAAARKTNS